MHTETKVMCCNCIDQCVAEEGDDEFAVSGSGESGSLPLPASIPCTMCPFRVSLAQFLLVDLSPFWKSGHNRSNHHYRLATGTITLVFHCFRVAKVSLPIEGAGAVRRVG